MHDKPVIDYRHVLRELSVNRQDPCEVIRELVSNSYDAGASKIWMAPLVGSDRERQGFVFVDNGEGLSQTKVVNGVTPYQAFFSVGKSTKVEGGAIGYKCQGSKLCFASSRFAVITRSEGDEAWRYRIIDRPRDNLDLTFSIASSPTDTPWEVLSQILSFGDARTRKLLEQFDKSFFVRELQKGTLILVLGLDVEQFEKFYAADTRYLSYIWNYLRFHTRYGDVRQLRTEETGFPVRVQSSLEKHSGFNDEIALQLWNGELFELVPSGWPYLPRPRDGEAPKAPDVVSRLRDGRFWARAAKTFRVNGEDYSVMLAIDGNRRALDNYPALLRSGQPNTEAKLRFVDQRGVLIACRGVRICAFNDIFNHPVLKDYDVLYSGTAQVNYTLIIDGHFPLVTNRNFLSEGGLKVLRSESFVSELRRFLDDARQEHPTFQKLIDKLRKDTNDDVLEKIQAAQSKLIAELKGRTRFELRDVPLLDEVKILAPASGEENGVAALYAMLWPFVPSTSKYRMLWQRPLTFSARGIDSVAQREGGKTLEKASLVTVEYKLHFTSQERFNHPLKITNCIVCWTFDDDMIGKRIEDDLGWFGTVETHPEFSDVAVRIGDLQSINGESDNGKVSVVSLEKLMRRTFDVKVTVPPPVQSTDAETPASARKGAKGKASSKSKGKV